MKKSITEFLMDATSEHLNKQHSAHKVRTKQEIKNFRQQTFVQFWHT
jgi:hypothetical protein